MVDFIFTKVDNIYGKIIERYAKSYWSHASIVVNDIFCPELYIDKKEIMLYPDVVNRQNISDYKIIRNIDVDDINNTVFYHFQDAKYETFSGLYRLCHKTKNGKDFEDISSSEKHFTCSSLLAKSLEDLLDTPFHYSQFCPDDLYKFVDRLK